MPNDSPTHSEWLRIEAVLDRFEEAWQSSSEPRIADYVLAGSNRSSLLLELVKIDVEYRWRSGRPRSMAEYVAEFPELSTAADELQAEESRLREFYAKPATTTRSWRRGPSDQTKGMKPSAAAAEQPQSLGGYEIRQKLGGGAFSTVYRAWDAELRRDVAIKVPHPGLFEDKDGALRLRREASSAARLRHPAIVSLHQVCGDGDKTFLVYQFVHGQTLAQVLRATRPAPEQAAQWVVRLADALAYAHSCGIVHRDVKPANILMDQDGRPMLADFGLALQIDASVKLTQQGDILGTPAYMSPEQAGGQNHQVDARSDVYSLGVVLYEILTGKAPFTGSAASVLQQVIHEEPPSMRRLEGGIPLDLETICLKAMAKEPGRRYTTAGELAEDLRRYLRHEPIQARRIGPLGRLARWCRRKPALAATIGIAIVTVAIVTGFSYWEVLQERDRFRAERDRAQANLYRALTSDTRAQFIARDTAWWWKAMDNIREAAKLEVAGRDIKELRELAIEGMGTEYYSLRQTGAWNDVIHKNGVAAIAMSADRQWLATAGRGGEIKIFLAAQEKLLATLVGHEGSVSSIAFHPTLPLLVSGSQDGALCLWDLKPLESGRDVGVISAVQRHVLCSKGVTAVACSPNGSVVAAGCADGVVCLFRVGEKDVLAKSAIDGRMQLDNAITCLAFAPSGTKLATGDAGKMIRLWDVDSRNQVLAFLAGQTPSSLHFSPDGGTIGWSEVEGFGFGRRFLREGSAAAFPRVHGSRVNQIHIDPTFTCTAGADGSLVISGYTSFDRRYDLGVARVPGTSVNSFVMSGDTIWAGYSDGKLRMWNLFRPPQRHMVTSSCQSVVFLGRSQRLVDESFVLPGPAYRPQDAVDYRPKVSALVTHPAGQLAWSDGRGGALFWDLRDNKPFQVSSRSDAVVSLLAGDPKGELLASASREGAIEVSKWKTGEVVRRLAPALGSVHSLCWSTDGRFLVAAAEGGVRAWDAHADWQGQQIGDGQKAVVAAGLDLLAIAAGDTSVEIRRLESGKVVHVLRGHKGSVSAMRFFKDGRRLASLGQAEAVRLWDAQEGKELGALVHQQHALGTALAIDPHERYLCAGGPASLMVWDLPNRVALGPIIQGVNDSRCEFLADGSGLIFSAFEGSIRLLTVAAMEKALAAARGPGKQQTLTGLTVFDSETVVPGGNSHRGWCVAASPDGQCFAVACHDGTVHLWDSVTLRKKQTFTGHTGLAWTVAFSADSKYLASGAQEVKVWEIATGKEVHNWIGHTRLVRSVAFHPKKPILASSSSDGTVRLWNLETGEPLGILHRFSKEILNLTFDPEGKHLVGGGGDGKIAVWQLSDDVLTDGKELPPTRILTGHQGTVWAVAFHPDGRYLASGSAQGTIILWDGKTFEHLATLKGGTGEIRGLSFSHDGELLAGSAYVNRCIVWNLPLLRNSLKGMNLDW